MKRLDFRVRRACVRRLLRDGKRAEAGDAAVRKRHAYPGHDQGTDVVPRVQPAAVARPATMIVNGVTYPITLTPRGITRSCARKPAISRRFASTSLAGAAGLVFEHQKHLKLAAFCKRAAEFQQKILLEYSAYRLYNQMTPESFRARLANIDYVDESGRLYISRVGFFVEDFSEVAKRNGMTQAHMPFACAAQSDRSRRGRSLRHLRGHDQQL